MARDGNPPLLKDLSSADTTGRASVDMLLAVGHDDENRQQRLIAADVTM